MAVTAQGPRSLAVGGDVVGSVVVLGDHNAVEVRVDGADARLLELLRPRRTPLPRPVHAVPAPDPRHVGRAGEVAALLRHASTGTPVEVTGPADVGKSFVARRALAAARAAGLPDGEVHVEAGGLTARDVLAQVLDAVVAFEPPAVPGDQALRRELRDLRALVVVDGHDLDRAGARAVRAGLPGCHVVLVARERALGEGPHVDVGGLPEADALRVAEQELGRPLAGAERAAAAAACAALAGHPFAVRRAAAAVAAGAPWPTAPAVPQDDPVVSLVASAGGAPVPMVLLSRQEAARAEALVAAHVLAAVPGGLRAPGAEAGDPAELTERTTRWAHARRGTPRALLVLAPLVLALTDRAAAAGHARAALDLARSADAALALDGRLGAWRALAERALALARDVGDPYAEAWALHQAGTAAGAVGDPDGLGLLEAALALRARLGDEAGATRHNLEVLRGGSLPPAPPGDDGGRRAGPRAARTLALAGAALVLGAGAGVGGARIAAPDPVVAGTEPPVTETVTATRTQREDRTVVRTTTQEVVRTVEVVRTEPVTQTVTTTQTVTVTTPYTPG